MQLWREIRNVCGLQFAVERARSRMKRLNPSFLTILWFSSLESIERFGGLMVEDDCNILSVIVICRSIGRRGIP